jgi:6-phosphogluconolactonase
VKVQRFATRGALDTALASHLQAAIGRGGALMLSGGNTPRPAYAQLSARPLHPGADLALLYSDERHVPADSPASNYRASLPLIEALALPERQVLRVRTELALDEAAADYARQLSDRLAAGAPIHLGLLGLGADGHTASLFTPADLDRARGQLAIAVHRPDGMQAVSVTPSLLERIERVLFVVTGADKRAALTALLARDRELLAWRAVSGCIEVEVWIEGVDV